MGFEPLNGKAHQRNAQEHILCGMAYDITNSIAITCQNY